MCYTYNKFYVYYIKYILSVYILCVQFRRLSYPINTSMTGFTVDGFQISFHPCALDKSSLSIGRVKIIEHFPVAHYKISHKNVLDKTQVPPTYHILRAPVVDLREHCI